VRIGEHRIMPRITVTLDEEQDEWVAEQAEQRDRPKAYIIRDLIESHRTDETSIEATSTDATSTASSNTGLTNEDVAELHDRVGRLESAFREILEGDGVDGSAGEPPADHTPTPSGSARERHEGESDAKTESTDNSRNGTATDSRPQSPSGDLDGGEDPIEGFIQSFYPNWNENVERRRDAVEAALKFIRDRGRPAGRSDFETELLPGHSIPSQSTDTWWKRTVRPGLNEAREAGLLEYREGHHDYRFTGATDADV
jgi:predicted transcriptional regulator